jgi:hypothetical protein
MIAKLVINLFIGYLKNMFQLHELYSTELYWGIIMKDEEHYLLEYNAV